MKFVKMLGLLAVAAAALMAFAGTASADSVTAPLGTAYTGKIHAESIEGHVTLHGAFGTIECASTVEGELTSHGAGKHVSGPITTLDFTGCTNNKTAKALKNGTLTLDVTKTNVGTLYSIGAEVTTTDHATGVNCIFTTEASPGTKLGTVTGSEKSNGQLDIESALIPRTGHSIFCGSTGTWTGTYKVTKPIPFHLHAN